MGLVGVVCGLIVSMLWAGAMAQSGCTTALIGLAPCLSYVTGNATTPSTSCCSQLASVVRSQPRCLCQVLGGGGGGGIMGFTINQTLALALPGACNVKTPPVSACNVANGPATSPTISPSDTPASSPTDASNIEPESPATSPGPEVNGIPAAGGGSKTVGQASSGASLTNIPNFLPNVVTVFLVFTGFYRFTVIFIN
ncbi:hypothetical protein Sjap_006532 [Stephania japonica]|uniref:Bifunctional inhibitor/plant lipid transfer protein/seed storage helical domain-containing protein n=1 Tax=Stephania japonica TaxID=461633 RepID=A0AAP0K7R0_9MAGN